MKTRDDAIKTLAKIQMHHVAYFRKIKLELFDCLFIYDDLSIAVKPHCTLTPQIISELKNKFVVKE